MLRPVALNAHVSCACCGILLYDDTDRINKIVYDWFSFFIRASYLYMRILTFSHLSLVRLV